jgi:hypothetical protein
MITAILTSSLSTAFLIACAVLVPEVMARVPTRAEDAS